MPLPPIKRNAFAIVAIPHDKQLTPEVITPFPNRGVAEHFCTHLRNGNRYWSYYVVPARDPIPVNVQRPARY